MATFDFTVGEYDFTVEAKDEREAAGKALKEIQTQKLAIPQEAAAQLFQLAGQQQKGSPLETISNVAGQVRDVATKGSQIGHTAIQALLNLPQQVASIATGQQPKLSGQQIAQGGRMVAEAVVPQTPTQALLMGGLAGHGAMAGPATKLAPAAMQALQRLGIGAGAAAVGAPLEGKGLVENMMDTLPYQVVGELAMIGLPAAQAITRAFRGPGAASPEDLKSVTGALQADIPGPERPVMNYPKGDLRGSTVSPARGEPTADDLYDLVQKRLMDEAGQVMEAGENTVLGIARKNAIKAFPNYGPDYEMSTIGQGLSPRRFAQKYAEPKVNIPALNQFKGLSTDEMMTLEEAIAAKKELGKVAFPNKPINQAPSDLKYDPVQLYDQARAKLGEEIERVGGKDARALYDYSNDTFRKSLLVKEYFTGGMRVKGEAVEKTFPKEGTFNMSELQGKRFHEYYGELKENKMENLIDSIKRFGGPTAVDRVRMIPATRWLLGGGMATQTPGAAFHTYGGQGTPVPAGAIASPQAQAVANYLLYLAQQQK